MYSLPCPATLQAEDELFFGKSFLFSGHYYGVLCVTSNRQYGVVCPSSRGKINPPVEHKRFITGSQNALKSVTSALEKLCNAVEDHVDESMHRPLKPSVDPKLVFADNFAPVEEKPPMECPDVEGILPECVQGVYIRNGPNPRYIPRSGEHYFEGDGMLHALTIKNGRITFCSRYVRTNKFVQENVAGRPIFPRILSGFYGFEGMARLALIGARIALGQINPFRGFGSANTSVLFFGKKLMALFESDLPYVVKLTEDGDIETVGRHDFNGKLWMAMTAHPKIDPDTGEMFTFRHSVIPPFLKLFRVESSGEVTAGVPILSQRRPSFIHDFAITKKYVIFPDTQFMMGVMEMIKGKGSPVGYDGGKVPRLGVIPRYATDDRAMKWFEVPRVNVLHTVNAWDESDDEIVLIAPNVSEAEHVFDTVGLLHFSLEKICLNVKTGCVTRRTLSSKSFGFGAMNQRFISKRNRYAYMSVGVPLFKSSEIVKLDLEMEGACEECVVASRTYDDGWFGSEPFFVARKLNAREDDGYVVAFTHNEHGGTSKLVVMDAQSTTLEMVASIHIPRRIPYGFHGLFVPRGDMPE